MGLKFSTLNHILTYIFLFSFLTLSACEVAGVLNAHKKPHPTHEGKKDSADPVSKNFEEVYPASDTDLNYWKKYPVDENGWSKIPASSDSRRIYVSSSLGSDGNSGESPLESVKSLEKAQSLLRENKGDWILLKEGDVFDESLRGSFQGESKEAPVVITSFCHPADKESCGTRPLISADRGLDLRNREGWGVRHLVVRSLHFRSPNYRGEPLPDLSSPAGIFGEYKRIENFLVEDCVFENFMVHVQLYWSNEEIPYGIDDLRFRRNIFTESYVHHTFGEGGRKNVEGYDRKARGLTLAGRKHTLIEENLFYKNGFKEGDPLALRRGHNSLIASRDRLTGEEVIVRRNLIVDVGNEAIFLQRGGVALENVIARAPNSILVLGSEDEAPIYARVERNLVLEGIEADLEWGRGTGIEVRKPNSDSLIVNNFVFRKLLDSGNPAIKCPERGDFLVQANEVYDWGRGNEVCRASVLPSTVSSRETKLEDYHASLGKAADLDAFLEAAADRPVMTWNPRYGARAILDYFELPKR